MIIEKTVNYNKKYEKVLDEIDKYISDDYKSNTHHIFYKSLDILWLSKTVNDLITNFVAGKIDIDKEKDLFIVSLAPTNGSEIFYNDEIQKYCGDIFSPFTMLRFEFRYSTLELIRTYWYGSMDSLIARKYYLGENHE